MSLGKVFGMAVRCLNVQWTSLTPGQLQLRGQDGMACMGEIVCHSSDERSRGNHAAASLQKKLAHSHSAMTGRLSEHSRHQYTLEMPPEGGGTNSSRVKNIDPKTSLQAGKFYKKTGVKTYPVGVSVLWMFADL